MGQTNTKDLAKISSTEYKPQVEVVTKKLYEHHYGDVEVVRDRQTGRLLFHKTLMLDNLTSLTSELNALHARTQLKHGNVVEIVGYNSDSQSAFCSVHSKVSVFIEVIDHTLLNELENRRNTRTGFSEDEVLLVADSAVSALAYFQSKGHSHGDIRPYNIFVSPSDVKLSDPSLAPHKGQHGLHLTLLQNIKALLAPELLEQLPKKILTIKADKHKADVFSLGVTLLALATLSNPEDLYNYSDDLYSASAGKLNTNLLNQRLDQVAASYSPFTYNLIKGMLAIQPQNRPDFATLANSLLPYKDRIRGRSLRVVAPTAQVLQTVVPTYTYQYAPTTYIVPGTYTTGTLAAGTTEAQTEVKAEESAKKSSLPAGSKTEVAGSKTEVAGSKTEVAEKKEEATEKKAETTTTGTTVLPAGYATRTYTSGTYLPGTYTTGGYTTGTTYTTGEVLKRSYAPLTTGTYTTGTTVLPGTYTSGTYTTGEGVVRSYAPGTYTSGTYTTGTVLPSTYTTGTVVSGDATTTTTTGTTGTTEVLKRSYAPLTTGTYTTGTYTTGTTVLPGTYTSGTYTSGEVVKRSYAPIGGSYVVGGTRYIGGSPTRTYVTGYGVPTTVGQTATAEATTEEAAASKKDSIDAGLERKGSEAAGTAAEGNQEAVSRNESTHAAEEQTAPIATA